MGVSPVQGARHWAGGATEKNLAPKDALPESISSLLPKEGFLREYLEYSYPQTEAPAEAHLAAALVTTSALVGKKVAIPWADDQLYLNVWMNIVGASTLSRKTTTLRKAEKIVRSIEAALILPDDTTAAALMDQLVERDERVWFLSELGLLFAQCEAKYNIGLKQLLANLYDVPPELASARMRNQTESQVTRVQRPFVAILGASTAAWLNTHLNEADLLGGLYARFLHFPIPDVREDGRRISIPAPVDSARFEELLVHARSLYGYRGTLDPGKICRQYDVWYQGHRAELYRLDDRERLGPFWGRLETYCLKLAALYHLSQETSRPQPVPHVSGERCLLIEPDALSLAIELTEVFKKALIRLFSQELALSRTEAAMQRLMNRVRRAKDQRMSRRDLQRRSGLLRDDFKRVMDTLLEDGRLRQMTQKTPSGQSTEIVMLGEDEGA